MKSLSLSWVALALTMGACSVASVNAAPSTSAFSSAAVSSPAVTYNVAAKPSRQSKFALAAFIETNINSGTDGGLYAETIRNRAFQDNVNNAANTNNALGRGSLLHWTGTSKGTKLTLSLDNSLSAALPQSAIVTGQKTDSCGIANSGFEGFSVTKQPYKLAFYARSPTGKPTTVPVEVGLYSSDSSKTFAKQTLPLKLSGEWQKFETTLTPSQATSNNNNVFAIKTQGACNDGFQLNLVSLTPPTWQGTVARPDLAQALADIKPKYVRLPGGNDLEGNNIPSWFNWTNAVGDLKNRPGRTPTWTSDWNTEGLGLMELMDLTEKWGAQAVLGIYAGYSLDGKAVPQNQLGPYIQSALNQLHFLLDTTGRWADLRKSYGRAAPYKFQHVEIGNEDWLGAAVQTYGPYRWAAFRDAIAKEFPQLTLIASTLLNGVEGAKAVDNHFYATPSQLFAFAEGMDATSRAIPIWELEYAVINNGLTNDSDIYSGPGRLKHPTLIVDAGPAELQRWPDGQVDFVLHSVCLGQLSDRADPRYEPVDAYELLAHLPFLRFRRPRPSRCQTDQHQRRGSRRQGAVGQRCQAVSQRGQELADEGQRPAGRQHAQQPAGCYSAEQLERTATRRPAYKRRISDSDASSLLGHGANLALA
ncbi:hypothetical protein L1887_52155 [Cichorium endivia]|nr:hypothetical protein L1887_52155 [Cichorium endivia]